ncbi:unannotated protein [freshwater metagenome]|uniref:Unannotated protein n=1 Tax=freshwater metagenome TaxID=449393 RepID=A0A6J7M6H5_9ZZZZ
MRLGVDGDDVDERVAGDVAEGDVGELKRGEGCAVAGEGVDAVVISQRRRLESISRAKCRISLESIGAGAGSKAIPHRHRPRPLIDSEQVRKPVAIEITEEDFRGVAAGGERLPSAIVVTPHAVGTEDVDRPGAGIGDHEITPAVPIEISGDDPGEERTPIGRQGGVQVVGRARVPGLGVGDRDRSAAGIDRGDADAAPRHRHHGRSEGLHVCQRQGVDRGSLKALEPKETLPIGREQAGRDPLGITDQLDVLGGAVDKRRDAVGEKQADVVGDRTDCDKIG